jgi:putative hydrolase of the HAD superfamily
MTIRLLTFDLDDTLWELAPVLMRAEDLTHQWLQRHAPTLTARYSAEALRTQRLQLMKEEPARAHRISDLRIDALRRALRAVGSSEEEATRLAAEAFAVFIDARHDVQLFEAVENVLEILQRDYCLGVITNGNADVRRLGISRFFDFAVSSERLARAKPHPEPFELALSLGRSTAQECIHIGDHVDHDIRAAQRLGIHTIWLNRHGEPWPGGGMPTARITQWEELPAAVAAIAATTR